MRRFATLALSLLLLLGLTVAGRLAAQDEKKEAAKPAPADAEKSPVKDQDKAKAPDAGKAETKEAEAAPPPMQSLTPPDAIPPEVEQKLEAARKAVAEAIVAAQDANLVDSTINPPPILDILLLGRADDKATLSKIAGKTVEAGVSPEVFGAWFTGYGQLENITAEKNVRIVPPSKGLKAYYDRRATLFNRYIDEARKDKGSPEQPKEEMKKGEAPTPKVDEQPKEATKNATPKAEEKKDQPKDEPKAEEPKKDETPKDEPKAEEPKKDETSKDEPKAEEPKKDETSKDEPKAEEKKDETSKDEPKAEEKKDEPKPEEPKAEEKKDEPKPEEPKDEESKDEESKDEQPE